MRGKGMQDEFHQRKGSLASQHVRRLEREERASSFLKSKSLQPLHRIHGLTRRPRPKTREQWRLQSSDGQNSRIASPADGHRTSTPGLHHRSHE